MKLQIKDVHKSFAENEVLKNINFTIRSGKAMGFLGRNGAGKTTTIRALMGVFDPDRGEFLLDGKKFNPEKHKVGYMPEERGMYEKAPIIEQLVYFARLKGMDKKLAKKSAKYWVERFGLSAYLNKKFETLSKGNQQKIQIVQAIINDPDILILDEPFSGLDPVNSQALKEIIREFIDRDKLVIFSSHQMGYVEEFCDEITFIHKGEIVLNGNLKEIKKVRGDHKIRLVLKDLDDNHFIKLVDQRIEGIEISKDRKSLIVKLNQQISAKEFLKQLIDLEITIEAFSPYEPSLEDIFIESVGD